jgi:hypothetical protein
MRRADYAPRRAVGGPSHDRLLAARHESRHQSRTTRRAFDEKAMRKPCDKVRTVGIRRARRGSNFRGPYLLTRQAGLGSVRNFVCEAVLIW